MAPRGSFASSAARNRPEGTDDDTTGARWRTRFHRLAGPWLALLASLVCSPPIASLAAPEFKVVQTANELRIDNGLVRLELQRTNGGWRKSFLAIDTASGWRKVCSAFVPDFRSHPEGNPLFDTANGRARYRVHESTVDPFTVDSSTPGRVTVRMAGTSRGAALSETTTLLAGDKYFHVTVTATLPTNVLDYCMSSYVFESDGPPDFVHSPTVKKDERRWVDTPASGQVIGDMAFHSPAVILQTGGLFAALVPDLESINRDQVLSPDARRTRYVGATVFDTPVDPAHYSIPTALDLNLASGLSSRPVFSYGLMDYVVSHHMRYFRPNDDSLLRTLATSQVAYAFDLFVGAREPDRAGFQQVSRHLWEKYGRPVFRGEPHLALPFEEYVKLVYSVVSRPMPPKVQPPVPGYEDHGVFLDFTFDQRPVCGMVAPLGGLGFGDALWNSVFWNPVRDASGMDYWGRRLGMRELRTRARNIVNLALLAPRNPEGLFCLTYLAQSNRWLRGTVSPDSRSIFSKADDTYDVPAMSKTGVHLLQYYRQVEADPRILDYLTPYADWLAATVDAQGRLPSYFSPAMVPKDPLPLNAQSGASLWFLAEFHAITNHPAWFAAARRIADDLTRNVVPTQRWIDLEPYFSCGQNPNSFTNDTVQGMPVRGNLSTLWAAEGFASLYRATGSNQFLATGERIIDYLAFSQCGWRPHYVHVANPFGGFTSDNVDTSASLDARQAETVGVFFWYGQALGRQDLLERAVAAARSGATLVNHPLHLANAIYSHPNLYGIGLGPENINHEGKNQSAMRTHPSWGECSSIFTGLATADRLMGGAYVNATNGLGVGVDGLWCTNAGLRGNVLGVTLSSQLAAHRSPWTAPFRTTLRLVGLDARTNYSIRINDLAPIESRDYPDGFVPLVIRTNGAVSIIPPERGQAKR